MRLYWDIYKKKHIDAHRYTGVKHRCKNITLPQTLLVKKLFCMSSVNTNTHSGPVTSYSQHINNNKHLSDTILIQFIFNAHLVTNIS